MSTMAKNRRRQRRYQVGSETMARVEFECHGRFVRCEVTNLSASGLSFKLDPDEDRTGLDEGESFHEAVVRVGDCAMRGELLLMHMTQGPGSRYVCGALFYPATDTDLVKLKSVIAGMEIAGTD
jgi:hypothetical protein